MSYSDTVTTPPGWSLDTLTYANGLPAMSTGDVAGGITYAWLSSLSSAVGHRVGLNPSLAGSPSHPPVSDFTICSAHWASSGLGADRNVTSPAVGVVDSPACER